LKAFVRVGIALWVAGSNAAWAGRPLITDNAGILPEAACQLESWLRPSRNLHQFVVHPACNPWGGVEWGASWTRERATEGPSTSLLGLQGKTVFKEVEPGSWGAGASLGLSRQVEGESTGITRAATLIFTVAPSQPLAVHVNVGALQASSRHAVANWAAAIEYSLNERWTLVAESYGERHGRPARQIGARTWIRPDSLQFDATLGREQVNGRGETFATIGLVWVWDKVWARR
jgi:hypothetical protein